VFFSLDFAACSRGHLWVRFSGCAARLSNRTAQILCSPRCGSARVHPIEFQRLCSGRLTIVHFSRHSMEIEDFVQSFQSMDVFRFLCADAMHRYGDCTGASLVLPRAGASAGRLPRASQCASFSRFSSYSSGAFFIAEERGLPPLVSSRAEWQHSNNSPGKALDDDLPVATIVQRPDLRYALGRVYRLLTDCWSPVACFRTCSASGS